MTERDVRTSIGTAPIPSPRAAPDDAEDTAAVGMPQETAAPQPEAAHFPWPEPWHYSRGARPRSEYWDVTTASWRSRGPVRPAPPYES